MAPAFQPVQKTLCFLLFLILIYFFHELMRILNKRWVEKGQHREHLTLQGYIINYLLKVLKELGRFWPSGQVIGEKDSSNFCRTAIKEDI